MSDTIEENAHTFLHRLTRATYEPYAAEPVPGKRTLIEALVQRSAHAPARGCPAPR